MLSKKTTILAVAIVSLLLLNLGSGIIIKFTPEYYGNYVFLGTLITGVCGIYFLRTLMWLFLGKNYQISYVYPLLSVNYVLSLFVGVAVFHEPFKWQRLVGALIILGGVTLILFSKHRSEAKEVEKLPCQ
jgi:drug/metabolite transporter (DMT)-like permease